MQKKITFFMPPLGDGGLDRTVLKLASIMVEHGLSIDVVSIKAGGPFLKKIHPSVNVIDLGTSRALKALPKLISYLRREKPDVLISAQYYINILAIWGKIIAKVATKVIVTERLATSQDLEGLHGLKKCLISVLMRWFYPKANAIVAVSKGAAEDLAKLLHIPAEQIEVIYNPTIDNDIFKQARLPVEHPWFVQKKLPIIVSVGRLIYQKDYFTLLRAFAKVCEKIDARLVILGQGQDKDKLEALAAKLDIKEYIDLPGFVENPYNYLAKADLFVLSSRFEGMPNVLVEALAVGTAAISTDCPSGPREILPDSALVAIEDYTSMGEKIVSFLRDHNSRADLLEYVQSRLEKFKPEVCLESYMKLTNKL